MNTTDARRGRVQTVLGLIDPDDLGPTLMHEHLFVDGAVYFLEPTDPAQRELAEQEVSLNNLWFVRYNFKDSRDNLVLSDLDVAATEVSMFMEAGGGTIVDVTPNMPGSNPAGLVEVATRTGATIVRGCGYYIEGARGSDEASLPKQVDTLAARIVADVIEGDAESGVKAGIIGEIGCSWPLTDSERSVLQAAAVAQQETGASVSIHPGRNDRALAEIVDVLVSAGADPERVVLGHMDRCGYSLEARRQVLDRGCVLEYDLFGLEGYYPARTALHDGAMPNMPNDLGRVNEIRALIDLGYGDQLVISHDICTKMQLTTWGGWGYGHILRNVIPLMRLYGFTDDELDALLERTPRRLLTLV